MLVNTTAVFLCGTPVIYSVLMTRIPLTDECQSLRENNMKIKQQLVDSQRRERLMMRRLAAKEQELLDYVNQVAELKAVQTPGQSALKAAMLDPAVNVLFQKLKQELQATQARLEETQNELAAWKFTPDSNTGKRLMAKCRLLHQENEELGKLTSNGRLAKLEIELAMQKGVSEDLKKSHCGKTACLPTCCHYLYYILISLADLDEVLLELEEDVEGMQNTILLMQRELKAEKERTQSVERENGRMLSVLRDKPEWLAAVQAKQEEAAAQERLKEEQAVRRLNGVGSVCGQMEVESASGAEGTEPMDTAQVRTRSGGVLSGVDDQAEGQQQVSGAGGNTNNGQSMVVTRKRTRSSVAVNSNSVVGGADEIGEGVEAMSVDEQEVPSVPATNCSAGGGKRNRRSSSISEQMKSAPRTRGQLQIESEKAKLEGVKEQEEVFVAGAGGGVENGQADSEVCSVVHSNNGIGGGGVAAAVAVGEENGTAEALKLKMENGSGGVAAVVDLRPENASV